MFTVYIIYAELFDSFYIGYTANLEVRLKHHNSGLTKSTKSKIPWKLVYEEVFKTKSEAIKRERFLKAQKNKSFYKRLANF